ncbi:class I SAM-dependent methyltransferase [Conexibacter arvalis]|uniref:Trans-aconitate 2-methyltransferase n=1 Tax=Conexibacter arvalis TaxID=912552 RepID=A0A840IHZ0_9ACTN|nr:methyltransferase domain-containing protein [Conexibacter arvalis]MBB4663568.1 trans-aconitate 2-methyltransferase [Conexibacter arvalis]
MYAMVEGLVTREWDAGSYHRVSTPHQDWGRAVLERLELDGGETVLDLGCGTGRITRALLERLPDGRVIAVDGSAAMVAAARENLPAERATVVHSDLLALDLAGLPGIPADAAISTATFHWIADHDALFARVRDQLRPGAQFVAQCGGAGNLARVRPAIDRVAAGPAFADVFAGWRGPWHYATAEETAAKLERAGFEVADCWLQPWPVTVADPRTFYATVILGAHLDRLPAARRDGFVDAVLEVVPDELDYVRLNWVARRR